jgi:hypothetical protein
VAPEAVKTTVPVKLLVEVRVIVTVGMVPPAATVIVDTPPTWGALELRVNPGGAGDP